MPLDRSADRNVRFFDHRNPDVVLGGLVQNGSVTEKTFLSMLNIVLVTSAPLRVSCLATGNVVSMVDVPLQLGDYLVSCDDRIQINDEQCIHRVISFNVSGRQDAFREGIRARDSRCVFSAIVNRRTNNWTRFEAAHVFPLGKEDLWLEFNYGPWITDMDATAGVSKINSLQNGLLLRRDIHADFDQHLVSVNPDDNYRIIVFAVDDLDIDGNILDPVCRNPEDPHRVSDQLLRWHFRQSVLANMRGAGEPTFEHDFPAGTDMMGEIRQGPYAQERFEMELASRLRPVVRGET